MTRLNNLNPGSHFWFRGFRYTVCAHEGAMTEVYSNGKRWAWPCRAMVKLTR